MLVSSDSWEAYLYTWSNCGLLYEVLAPQFIGGEWPGMFVVFLLVLMNLKIVVLRKDVPHNDDISELLLMK